MMAVEREILEREMVQLGLSEAERDAVRHFEGAEGAVEVIAALPEAERQSLIDHLVDAALADGKLTPAETAVVKRIGAALQLGG